MHCPTLRSPPGRSVPPHRARTHRARHRGRSTTSSSDLPRHACGAGLVESGARTRRSEAGRRGGRRSSEDIDRARDRRFGARPERRESAGIRPYREGPELGHGPPVLVAGPTHGHTQTRVVRVTAARDGRLGRGPERRERERLASTQQRRKLQHSPHGVALTVRRYALQANVTLCRTARREERCGPATRVRQV